MYNILVTMPFEGEYKKRLEEAGKDCRIVYAPIDEVTAQMVQDADAIIGNVPANMIAMSEKLKWMQLNSAGADAYLKPGVLGPGTMLTNSTGAYGTSVGEHALAMLLMLLKNLHIYRDAQTQAKWIHAGPAVSIADLTVAVIGLGDIGLHFARLVKALGAYVIGIKRRPSACPEGVDELYTPDKLDEVLPRADVVMSVLPGTAETYHIFTKERFKRMKNSAIFLNSGRGSSVALEVLYDALKEGDIAAAGVDVLEQEPLDADSPLWGLENLLITPHISGGFRFRQPETVSRVLNIAIENLAAFTQGRELKNLVDFETGYRR